MAEDSHGRDGHLVGASHQRGPAQSAGTLPAEHDLSSPHSAEDVWQLHYSAKRGPSVALEEMGDPGDPEFDAPEPFIANLDETPAHSPAYLLKVSVRPDGSFMVTNTRNGFNKEYRAGAGR